MNIAIDIPDDIGKLLAAQAEDVPRAVLEADRNRGISFPAPSLPRKCSKCSGCAQVGKQNPSSGAPKPSRSIRWMIWNGTSPRFVAPRANNRPRGCSL